MNYALGCDLNQSPKYVGLHDDAELVTAKPLIPERIGYSANVYDIRGRDSDGPILLSP